MIVKFNRRNTNFQEVLQVQKKLKTSKLGLDLPKRDTSFLSITAFAPTKELYGRDVKTRVID